MIKKKKRSKQPSQVPPLDDRHFKAIELFTQVIEGKRKFNRTQIAQKCNISRMQLYRWELREDFRKELDKRTKQKLNRIHPPRRKYETVDLAIAGDVKSAKLMLSIRDMI